MFRVIRFLKQYEQAKQRGDISEPEFIAITGDSKREIQTHELRESIIRRTQERDKNEYSRRTEKEKFKTIRGIKQTRVTPISTTKAEAQLEKKIAGVF